MDQNLPQHSQTTDDMESNSFVNCPMCEHSCLPIMLRVHLFIAHSKELTLEEINLISEEAINCKVSNTGNEPAAVIASAGVLPVEELETTNNMIPLAASRFSIVTTRGDIVNNVVEKTTPTTDIVDFGLCDEIVGNSHSVHAIEDSIHKKLQLQAIRAVLHKPSCGREASGSFEPESQIKQMEAHMTQCTQIQQNIKNKLQKIEARRVQYVNQIVNKTQPEEPHIPIQHWGEPDSYEEGNSDSKIEDTESEPQIKQTNTQGSQIQQLIEARIQQLQQKLKEEETESYDSETDGTDSESDDTDSATDDTDSNSDDTESNDDLESKKSDSESKGADLRSNWNNSESNLDDLVSKVHFSEPSSKPKPTKDSLNSNAYQETTIQGCINSLIHADQCLDDNCDLPSCLKIKKMINHSCHCKRKLEGRCPICKQLEALCCYHAKQCKDSKCSLHFCQHIKQKLQKQHSNLEQAQTPEQTNKQTSQEQSVDKSGAWNGMEEALVSNWQRKLHSSCNIIVAQKSRFATNLPGAKFATTQNGHIFISMIGGQHYELLEIVGGPKITAFTPFLMEILDQLPGDARFVCVCSKAIENSTPLNWDSALISKWRSKMGPSYNIIVAQKSRFKTVLPGGATQNGHYFVSMKYGYGEQHKYELLEIVGLNEPSGVSESELEVILGLMPEDAKIVCGLPKATRYDITTERESAQKKMELSHSKVINLFFFIFNFHSWELNFLY